MIPPSAFDGEAVVAELTSDAEDIGYIQVDRYGDFEIPTRAFKRLGSIKKRSLPTKAYEFATTPTAFVLIGRSDRRRLYEVAYGSYSQQGNFISQFEVTGQSFNVVDDLRLSLFFNTVAANTKFIVGDGENQTVSPIEAVNIDLGDFAPELASNINSPGYLSLLSQYISPLVAAALWNVAIFVGPEAVALAAEDKITIGNSVAGDDDPCTVEVSKAALTQLKIFGVEGWTAMCELALRAHNDTGVIAVPQVRDSQNSKE